jgi:hypothetical protein
LQTPKFAIASKVEKLLFATALFCNRQSLQMGDFASVWRSLALSGMVRKAPNGQIGTISNKNHVMKLFV